MEIELVGGRGTIRATIRGGRGGGDGKLGWARASKTHIRVRIDLVHGDVPRVVVPGVRVAHVDLARLRVRLRVLAFSIFFSLFCSPAAPEGKMGKNERKEGDSIQRADFRLWGGGGREMGITR